MTTLEAVFMAAATAIVVILLDVLDCRRLRRDNSKLTEHLLEKDQKILELHERLLKAWWDAMEEAAQIVDKNVPNSRSAAEIRRRIQDRATQ